MRVGRQESGLRHNRSPLFALVAVIVAQSRGFTEPVAVWVERVRTRRHLTRLSDHMLKDIGISRTDMARETEKPFWRK